MRFHRAGTRPLCLLSVSPSSSPGLRARPADRVAAGRGGGGPRGEHRCQHHDPRPQGRLGLRPHVLCAWRASRGLLCSGDSVSESVGVGVLLLWGVTIFILNAWHTLIIL